jgi:hypothetical protein
MSLKNNSCPRPPKDQQHTPPKEEHPTVWEPNQSKVLTSEIKTKDLRIFTWFKYYFILAHKLKKKPRCTSSVHLQNQNVKDARAKSVLKVASYHFTSTCSL